MDEYARRRYAEDGRISRFLRVLPSSTTKTTQIQYYARRQAVYDYPQVLIVKLIPNLTG